ncbi:MAG: winged helix-turn-helix transcriptional regulator [Acidobacteriaceae bacterium]
MDALLHLLMGPWTTVILWILRQNGPLRYGRIKHHVSGISARMLTERLRLLEDAGILYRTYLPTIPPQVTYGLTERGQELGPILDRLDDLAQKWQKEDEKRLTPPRQRAVKKVATKRRPGA